MKPGILLTKNNKNDNNTIGDVMVFDDFLQKMPKKFQCEIIGMDKYLKTLRPMKFKRVLDKNCNKITYVAPEYGISYMFKLDGGFKHNFQWYIVHNGKAETWHRKADYMEETLVKIAQSDQLLSVRIYNALKNCPGSNNCYGERCLARTPYSFNGKKRLTCHGSVEPGLDKNDFNDVREFFRYLNELINEKISNNVKPPEKIILCKKKRYI